MSARALVLGVAGAVLIAAVGYLNDSLLGLSPLVGSHLPVALFGLMVFFAVTVNPLLWRIRRSWRLRPSELAVAAALVLVACSIPGSGLMRYFTHALALPAHYNEVSASWQQAELLSRYTPAEMLPNGGQYDATVTGGFVRGLGQPGRPIGLSDVPWGAWRAPLMLYLPLLSLNAVAVIALGVIVHRQWSRHESLRYPIAEFASMVTGSHSGRAFGAIFRDRRFWIGLLVVLGIRIANGLHSWYPGSINIPLLLNFGAVTSRWPDIARVPYGWGLLHQSLSPIVIGFAFFLSSSVGLSLGLSQFLFVAVMGAALAAGVDVSEGQMRGGVASWMRLGGYVAAAGVLLYTGRRYYGQVLRAALGLSRSSADRYGRAPVWACRILILAEAGVVLLFRSVGLDWLLAVLLALLVLLVFLVLSRMNAECGVFFMKPGWQPMGVLLAFFGASALGPTAIITLGLLTVVLTMVPSESLMPFVVNGLKMTDTAGVRPSRVGWWSAGTFAVALAVAVVVVLWANYNYGAPREGLVAGWSFNNAPRYTFDIAARAVDELRLTGRLDQAEGLGAWGRLRAAAPDPAFLRAAGVGLLLVAATGLLRLRYAWWPIHPVLFLVWGTWQISIVSHSFLLGWAIRTAVMRLGGVPTYRRLAPLMVGVIAGDMLGGLAFAGVGAAYYAATGLMPKTFVVFPP
jgi:hypothetical protein